MDELWGVIRERNLGKSDREISRVYFMTLMPLVDSLLMRTTCVKEELTYWWWYLSTLLHMLWHLLPYSACIHLPTRWEPCYNGIKLYIHGYNNCHSHLNYSVLRYHHISNSYRCYSCGWKTILWLSFSWIIATSLVVRWIWFTRGSGDWSQPGSFHLETTSDISWRKLRIQSDHRDNTLLTIDTDTLYW